MSEFRMPQLGADMAAATLTEWLAQPGDAVSHGDIVAVVETEKGAIEIEIFEDGVIDTLLVDPGTKVPVGTALATLLGGGGEKISAPTHAPTPTPMPTPDGATAAPASAPVARPQISVPSRTPEDRVRISPAAARRAAELNIDIHGLTGTGPGGAIGLSDVEHAAPREVPEPPEQANDTPAAAMRRAIAAAMGRSKREIPHYYLSTPIDMKPALNWLAEANRNRPVTERLIYSVLLIKAVARALEDFPELNGFWQDGAFRPAGDIHIGWAISLRGGGLVSPALHSPAAMDPDALMAALRDLVKRARAFRLRGSELSDPTITVTNLGDQGVENVFGIIYPPQVALVGFGRIVERPWVVDGALEPRPVIQASLAADHRVSDGHRGGRFLSKLESLLQEPETL